MHCACTYSASEVTRNQSEVKRFSWMSAISSSFLPVSTTIVFANYYRFCQLLSDRFWTTMPLHISPDEYTPFLQQYNNYERQSLSVFLETWVFLVVHWFHSNVNWLQCSFLLLSGVLWSMYVSSSLAPMVIRDKILESWHWLVNRDISFSLLQ